MGTSSLARFLLETLAKMQMRTYRSSWLQCLKSFRGALKLLPSVFLCSCVLYTDHQFSGAAKIQKDDHWIEMKGLQLARTDENKWYICGGPPGATVDCFMFSTGLPSFKQPTDFKVLRLELFYNNRTPVKFSRLSDIEDAEMKIWYASSRYEIWVPAQPYRASDEIPEGRYWIKLHYRFGNQEYDAEWQCAYKTRTKAARWHMPRC